MESWILYFMIYSVLGWICETVYCSILARHFVNRGFLNGPYCPIYGCGALLIIVLLEGISAYIPAVFLVGAVLTSALEYLTGWAMEKLFHHKWWDYSDKKYNLHGRVCLENSIMFGVLCVVVMRVLHPMIRNAIAWLPLPWRIGLAAAVVLLLLVDTAGTVRSVVHLNVLLRGMEQLKAELRTAREETAEEFRRKKAAVQLRLREAALEISPFQKRLLGAFPHMRSTHYRERLSELKAHLAELGRQGRRSRKGENAKLHRGS